MAVFCSFLVSCFPGTIIYEWVLDGSSCSYYYWYHYCLYISHGLYFYCKVLISTSFLISLPSTGTEVSMNRQTDVFLLHYHGLWCPVCCGSPLTCQHAPFLLHTASLITSFTVLSENFPMVKLGTWNAFQSSEFWLIFDQLIDWLIHSFIHSFIHSLIESEDNHCITTLHLVPPHHSAQ
jgi:hypothetical protein